MKLHEVLADQLNKHDMHDGVMIENEISDHPEIEISYLIEREYDFGQQGSSVNIEDECHYLDKADYDDDWDLVADIVERLDEILNLGYRRGDVIIGAA